MVVLPLIMSTNPHPADELATFCSIRGGNFIFWENRRPGTFWNTSTAIDASIRVDIIPWPLFDRFTGNNTLNRANFYTAGIS
jgi:hypothetical protein